MKTYNMNLKLQDLGVAILSTDRSDNLNRLLLSISSMTDTNNWQLGVFDDSYKQNVGKIKSVCDKSFVQYHRTGERIGVARNTNQAMKWLEPFKYKMILNNDVEVLHPNWWILYPYAMIKTGFHHFCFQQEGLWGAATKKRPETRMSTNGITVKTIYEFPQGACLVYDQKAFRTVGYFDALNFKSYGYSHHLWSHAVSISNIQPEGIHDVVGSNKYFKVHDEPSVTEMNERVVSYRRNGEIFHRELNKRKSGERKVYTDYA
jgi:hypothetical protein